MQIGGALGSLVGRALRVDARERRILLVAGVAAGVSAVFRTPLGAALLAVEVLHRDDFESDALVPSVLASVISYSVFISFFGEADAVRARATLPVRPRAPAAVRLDGALRVAGRALLRRCSTPRARLFDGSRLPAWAKPALGGLDAGSDRAPILIGFGPRARPRQAAASGTADGGYGAAQLAITGAAWLPGGWYAVELLLAARVAEGRRHVAHHRARAAARVTSAPRS